MPKVAKSSVRIRAGGDADSIAFNDSTPYLAKCLHAYGLLDDPMGDAPPPPALDDFQRMAADALVAGNPAGATFLAASLAYIAEEHGVSKNRAEDILQFIGRSATPRARWCMEWLSFWPGLDDVRAKAESSRSRFEKNGIPIEGPETGCIYSRSMVTCCDGAGSQILLVVAEHPVDGAVEVSMTVNDRIGFKDVMINFAGGDGSSELFSRGDHGMAMASVDLDFVRDIIADALWRHLDAGTAPPMDLFVALPFFGNEPIRPKRREPDLSSYGLDALTPTPDLVNNSAFLAEFPLAACLMPETGQILDFCRLFMPKRGDALSHRDFEAFLDGPMREQMPVVVDRLATNLEILAMSDKGESVEARRLAELWFGLKNKVLPYREIAFVRELAEMTTTRTIQDIRFLFANRR